MLDEKPSNSLNDYSKNCICISLVKANGLNRTGHWVDFENSYVDFLSF